MLTVLHDQILDIETSSREQLIGRIRAMLNAAEGSEDVVTLEFAGIQLDISFDAGELSIYQTAWQ